MKRQSNKKTKPSNINTSTLTKLTALFGQLILCNTPNDPNFKIFREELKKLGKKFSKPYIDEISKIPSHWNFELSIDNLIKQFIKDGININKPIKFVKHDCEFRCTALFASEFIEKNNIMIKALKANKANPFIYYEDNILSAIQIIIAGIKANKIPEKRADFIEIFKNLVSLPEIDIHQPKIKIDKGYTQNYIDEQINPQINSNALEKYIESKKEITLINEELSRPTTIFELILGMRDPEIMEILFKYHKIDFSKKITYKISASKEKIELAKNIEAKKILVMKYTEGFCNDSLEKVKNLLGNESSSLLDQVNNREKYKSNMTFGEHYIQYEKSIDEYVNLVLSTEENADELKKLFKKYNNSQYKILFSLNQELQSIRDILNKNSNGDKIHILKLDPDLDVNNCISMEEQEVKPTGGSVGYTDIYEQD